MTSCRIATTFRELTPEFLPGGDRAELGQKIIDIASTYSGTAVGCGNTTSSGNTSSSACPNEKDITNNTSTVENAICQTDTHILKATEGVS